MVYSLPNMRIQIYLVWFCIAIEFEMRIEILFLGINFNDELFGSFRLWYPSIHDVANNLKHSIVFLCWIQCFRWVSMQIIRYMIVALICILVQSFGYLITSIQYHSMYWKWIFLVIANTRHITRQFNTAVFKKRKTKNKKRKRIELINE